MTSQTKLKHIQKGLQMGIIKPQLQVTITKGELNTLINEALQDETASASIKRILNQFATGQFTQFPEFPVVTLGSTSEDGSTLVTLKQAAKPRTNVPEFEAGPEDEPDEPEIAEELDEL